MIPAHGAIVLAAGASTRLGQAKQLIEIAGEPLLHRVTRFVLATQPLDCVVVLGHDAARMASALEGIEVRTLRIDDPDAGMSASLRTGISALDARCEGALVVVTDQLGLTAEHLCALCAAWRASPERAAASAYADVIGVPAVLPRAWFGEIGRLRGDTGARELLRGRGADVVTVAAPELARDLDAPGDIAIG
ncbi:MAG TPA: nucleotidyltransferase family protein [Rhodanobacteraceae bacterium]